MLSPPRCPRAVSLMTTLPFLLSFPWPFSPTAGHLASLLQVPGSVFFLIRGVGSPKQSDLFGAGRTKSGEGCAVWKVLLDSSKPRKGREMKTLIMAWGSRYVNISSQVDFSISLQKTIFRNDTHHLLSTYYIPAAMLCVALGEAHVERSEGRFQTTASKELKPSAQQPMRNWIQLTTT
ncbi:uncharacterized protein [Sagmatias obliquidens]|uniref:uncharacterized protein isoform X6 n=1 Tax=Sagmatias obliquidens TaxID=3371155 RepID=UPI000F4404D4|nr:uncharacterized protein LOC113612167 isoform X6 [Lagenorhynchus obliquidens]